MIRAPFPFAALALPVGLVGLVGCAHGQPPPVNPQLPDPPPLAVTYRILRAGDGEGVLLSGRTLVDPHRGARVKAAAAHSSASQSLELDTRPEADGTLVMQAIYEETGGEGARLDWRPAMRIARGATARAEMTGGGIGRTLEITID